MTDKKMKKEVQRTGTEMILLVVKKGGEGVNKDHYLKSNEKNS